MKKKIKEGIKRLVKILATPEMLLLPGSLAFSFVLALIPIMTLITYSATVLNLSTDGVYNFLNNAFSKDIANLLLSNNDVANMGIRVSIVIIVCYILVSNGTSAIITCSNAIYGIKESNFFKKRFKALIMALIFTIMIIFLLFVQAFGGIILDIISNANLRPHIIRGITSIYNFLKGPLTWILLFLFIKLIYVIAPDRHVKANKTNYGALFTTVTWIITTGIYSYYINNIANYKAFYGGLTSFCVLMIWFYLLAILFVIGMSINYQKETNELITKKW